MQTKFIKIQRLTTWFLLLSSYATCQENININNVHIKIWVYKNAYVRVKKEHFVLILNSAHLYSLTHLAPTVAK